MAQTRIIIAAVLVLSLGLAGYNLYQRAVWEPNSQTKEAVRQAIGQADTISADQSHGESQPYLNKAQAEKKIDIAKLRETVIPGAKRAGELKTLNAETTAIANGAVLRPEERIVPPPPPPPPRLPVQAILPTLRHHGNELFITGVLAWTMFEQPIMISSPIAVKLRGKMTVRYSDSRGDAKKSEVTPKGLNIPIPTREGDVERLLPSAPFMAVIGRICSAVEKFQFEGSWERPDNNWSNFRKTPHNCSEPFLVGSGTVLCPANVGVGILQLAVNEDVVHAVGMSGHEAEGQFWVEADAASPNACGTTNVADLREEAEAWANNQVQRKPEFRLLGPQLDWKPFSIPPNRQLTIKAEGQIQPHAESAYISGPTGLNPEAQLKGYKLVDSRFKDNALLGRFCREDDCGPVFLVGDGTTVCARGNILELRINHIVGTYQTLTYNDGKPVFDPRHFNLSKREDLQEDLAHFRGAYRFELTAGAACK